MSQFVTRQPNFTDQIVFPLLKELTSAWAILFSRYINGTYLDDFYSLMRSDFETSIKNIYMYLYHVLYINSDKQDNKYGIHNVLSNSLGQRPILSIVLTWLDFESVYGEVGRYPLIVLRKIASIKY